MDEQNMILLEECPCCRGGGMLVHEGGWSCQVECSMCGAHTVYMEYDNEEERLEAEKAVCRLWNIGKVIKQDPGE